MAQYSPIMTVMIKAVRSVSGRLARDFGEVEQLQVSEKGPMDFVSSADLHAEERIVESLRQSRPNYGFLLEEGGAIAGQDERFRWVVDPLDGTNNFLHGLPLFAVTIAMEKKTPRGHFEVEAAVTYDIINRELFWAEKGQGAWVENTQQGTAQRLHVSARKKLSQSLLCVGSLKHDAGLLERLSGQVSGIRCLGSTALAMAYLAAGRCDIFMHRNSRRWDIAAGWLLIKEAKGLVTDFNQRAITQDRCDIVAANEALHTKILDYCK